LRNYFQIASLKRENLAQAKFFIKGHPASLTWARYSLPERALRKRK